MVTQGECARMRVCGPQTGLLGVCRGGWDVMRMFEGLDRIEDGFALCFQTDCSILVAWSNATAESAAAAAFDDDDGDDYVVDGDSKWTMGRCYACAHTQQTTLQHQCTCVREPHAPACDVLAHATRCAAPAQQNRGSPRCQNATYLANLLSRPKVCYIPRASFVSCSTLRTPLLLPAAGHSSMPSCFQILVVPRNLVQASYN